MTRINLKGLNRTKKKLADGSERIYYYLGKGGPRLEGEPGTPEFIASYLAAVEAQRRVPKDTLRSIIDAFQKSSDFTSLAAKTRADYRFSVLARIIAWAFNRGLVQANPCERPGRLYRSSRSERIWSDEDEAAFLANAPQHLSLALIMALWTGQRQGDLLKLTWNAYNGSQIRLKQRKTGARVVIPVGKPLKAELEKAKSKLAEIEDGKPRPLTILATEGGTAWTESGFRASWRKACAKAGVVGVTFHDLRGTAVTRLALAGCSEAEIATITGHSLRDVAAILDAHYLKRDPRLAESAIRKLERRTDFPN